MHGLQQQRRIKFLTGMQNANVLFSGQGLKSKIVNAFEKNGAEFGTEN